MLTIAIRAARKAASVIQRASRDLPQITIETKQHNDFVTAVDRAAEETIVDILRTAYPDHDIMGEEGGAQVAQVNKISPYRWIIDPLDGTTNFIHNFPQYAVSIALLHQEKLLLGVIYDPTRDELFSAVKGQGAYLNDKRLRVSNCSHLSQALLGTGFVYRDPERFRAFMVQLEALATHSAGIRRAGAAALDLAYVAAGRLDGFFEQHLQTWDLAAGALLVLEAGGMVGNYAGDSPYMDGKSLIAASPKVFAAMVGQLKSCPVSN